VPVDMIQSEYRPSGQWRGQILMLCL